MHIGYGVLITCVIAYVGILMNTTRLMAEKKEYEAKARELASVIAHDEVRYMQSIQSLASLDDSTRYGLKEASVVSFIGEGVSSAYVAYNR